MTGDEFAEVGEEGVGDRGVFVLVVVQGAVLVGVEGGRDEDAASVGGIGEVTVLDAETVGPTDLAGDGDAPGRFGFGEHTAHTREQELGVVVWEFLFRIARVGGFAGVTGHGLDEEGPMWVGEAEGFAGERKVGADQLDHQVLEIDEGDAVATGEIHGAFNAGIAAKVGVADETSGRVMGEFEGADAGWDGNGWKARGKEGDGGGGAEVGDGAGFGETMIDSEGRQSEVVHGPVEVFVADEIVEAVEGWVVGDEGNLADLVGDGEAPAIEIGGVVGLGGVAGVKGIDLEGGEGEMGEGVTGFEVFDELEGGDGGAEFDGAGRVEVFGIGAEGMATETRRLAGGAKDFSDEDLEAEIGGLIEVMAEMGTGRAEERFEVVDGIRIHGGATGGEEEEEGGEGGRQEFHG